MLFPSFLHFSARPAIPIGTYGNDEEVPEGYAASFHIEVGGIVFGGSVYTVPVPCFGIHSPSVTIDAVFNDGGRKYIGFHRTVVEYVSIDGRRH